MNEKECKHPEIDVIEHYDGYEGYWVDVVCAECGKVLDDLC